MTSRRSNDCVAAYLNRVQLDQNRVRTLMTNYIDGRFIFTDLAKVLPLDVWKGLSGEFPAFLHKKDMFNTLHSMFWYLVSLLFMLYFDMFLNKTITDLVLVSLFFSEIFFDPSFIYTFYLF